MNPSFDTSRELAEKVMELPRQEAPFEPTLPPVTPVEVVKMPIKPHALPQPQQVSSTPKASSPKASSPHVSSSGNISESVDVFTAPLPPSVREHLEPQPKEGTKYNHFQFKDKGRMERALTQRIQSAVSEPVEVEFHYNVKKRPDVLITRSSDHSTVGKVHFLHFNRPDMCDASKWFVKLYFYEFTDSQEYHAVRQAMVSFFKKLSVSRSAQQVVPQIARASHHYGGKTRRRRQKKTAVSRRRRHRR
jgi:hypothetical protein